MTKISTCMMIGGAAFKLSEFEKALASVKALSYEIIVVNTSAPPEADEIAERYGAKVEHHTIEPWDFSQARNLTFANATGDWILILDADEVFELLLPIQTFKRYLADAPCEVVALETIDRFSDSPASNVSSLSPRIFKADCGLRYEGKVHNQPQYEGRAGLFREARIIHSGYDFQSPDEAKAKYERSMPMIAADWENGRLQAAFFAAEYAGMLGERTGEASYFVEALKWCDRYVQAADEHKIENFNLSVFYIAVQFCRHLGQADKAIAWLDAGLKRDPEEPNLNFLFAEMAVEREMYDLAIEATLKHLTGYERWKKDPTKTQVFAAFCNPAHVAISHQRLAVISVMRVRAAMRRLEAMRGDVPAELFADLWAKLGSAMQSNGVFCADHVGSTLAAPPAPEPVSLAF